MNCDQARRLISERFDRRLSAGERAVLQAHLGHCEECRRFDRSLAAGLTALHRLPEFPPSEQTRAAVWAELNAEPVDPAPSWFGHTAQLAVATLAVLLVVTVAFTLLHDRGSGPPTEQLGAGAGTPVPSVVAMSTSATPTSASSVTSVASQPTATPQAVAGPTPPAPATPATAPSATPTPPVPPGPWPTPGPLTAQTASATVQSYFDAINRQDYLAAYSLLGGALQEQHFIDFKNGFATTAHDDVTIESVRQQGDGRYAVAVSLTAVQTDGSTRQYGGTYFVGQDASTVRILDANVTETTATPAGTTPATPAAIVTPTPTPTTGGGRACRAADLTAGYQGATQSIAGSVVVTSRGTSPCALVGAPQIQLFDGNGNELPTTQAAPPELLTAQPVTLQPGQQAYAAFIWRNWCPAGTQAAASAGPIVGPLELRVTLPGGNSQLRISVEGPAGKTIVPTCGAPDQPSALTVDPFKPYLAP